MSVSFQSLKASSSVHCCCYLLSCLLHGPLLLQKLHSLHLLHKELGLHCCQIVIVVVFVRVGRGYGNEFFFWGEVFGHLPHTTYTPRPDPITILGLEGSALRGRYCNALYHAAMSWHSELFLGSPGPLIRFSGQTLRMHQYLCTTLFVFFPLLVSLLCLPISCIIPLRAIVSWLHCPVYS